MSEHQIYEVGTIVTWENAGGRRIALRLKDGWHFDSHLPEASDEWISTQNVEILDPLQLPWKRKYEESVSSLEVKEARWARTRASIENERDNNASAHRRAEQKIRELENKLHLAELAVTDVERLKDAEIDCLKARLAAKEAPTADPDQVVQSLDSFLKEFKAMMKKGFGA